jgi:hypothetical protein
MTVLLLLFYFDRRQGWGSRFAIYDAVMQFVQLQVWDRAKSKDGKVALDRFFASVHAGTFHEDYPDAACLYDALSDAAGKALYGEDEAPLRRLTKEDLVAMLAAWIEPSEKTVRGLPEPRPGAGRSSERRAIAWFDQLRAAALFFQDGSTGFVFILSTVLEFLAARHFLTFPERLRNAMGCKGRESLETLPMLCGRAWETGHQLLNELPERFPGFTYDSAFAFACLAETDDAEARALDAFLAEVNRKPLRQKMEATQARNRYDEALAAILWSTQVSVIERAVSRLTGLLRLRRAFWPERYSVRGGIRWNHNVARELVTAREQFLQTILHVDLVRKVDQETSRAKEPATFISSVSRILYLGSPEWRVDISNHAGDRVICFSPDGTQLAVGNATGAIVILDASSGRTIRFWAAHERAVLSCAWEGSGKRLATASNDRTARVWDLDTGRELQVLKGHTNWVMSCAWEGSGKRLATASSDGTARAWDVDSGRAVRVLKGHTASVLSCASDGSGKRLATASVDGTARVWDVGCGRVVQVMQGHTKEVTSCAWVGGGKQLATASADGTVRLWETATGREDRKFTFPARVWEVTWDPTGRYLAAALANGLCAIIDTQE